MAKFCFFSFEIFPTVKGGAGVLLYNTARQLLPLGHEVIFVLDMPKEEFEQFDQIDRLTLPNPERCRVYFVWGMVQDMKVGRSDFLSDYEYRSYQFHHVARKVYQIEKPDVIEFFEYTGSAYYALNAKALGLDYQESRLAVRLHGALEMIDRMQSGGYLGIDRYVMYGLERQALRLAETVLTPSQTFLDQAYRPFYEPWYGETVVSEPPLIGWPQAEGALDNPDGVLFYGRLHGIKGVDIFVDAACVYLSDPLNPRRSFYLVGYDSEQSPGKPGSYRKYLLRKIPPKFHQYFHFTGQLSWGELGRLLPRIQFGVIPSYFESYCYAAHELYAAGLPLVVADIPGLHSDFIHEQNALLFDGTVSDLAVQMQRLSSAGELRRRLAHPYPLGADPLGSFYTQPFGPGWIDRAVPAPPLSLLICLLVDRSAALERSLASLRPLLSDRVKLVILHPGQDDETPLAVAWFLGRLYTFENPDGQALLPTEVLTRQAVLVLKAGDLVDPEFIRLSLEALQRYPQVNIVACWGRYRRGKWSGIATFPQDAVGELAPFLGQPILSRSILRCQADKLLLDLFDPRAGRFGELAYRWRLDDGEGCGLMISLPLVEYLDNEKFNLTSSALDYLLVRDTNPWRARRLARYLLTLKNRSRPLTAHYWIEWGEPAYRRYLRAGFNALRQSPLNAWLDHLPGVKNGLKKSLAWLRELPYRFRRSQE